MSIAEIGILVSWRLEKRRGEVRQAQVVARRERKAKMVHSFSTVSIPESPVLALLGAFCLGPMSRILPDAWCLWATILGLSLGQCFTAQFCLLWTTWSIKEAAMSSLSLVVWGALCCCCLIMPVPSALQPSGLENSTTRGMWHQWWLPLSQSCPVGVCPEYTLSYLFQTAGLDSFDVDILGPPITTSQWRWDFTGFTPQSGSH